MTHTIRLKADGKKIEDLEIQEGYAGDRGKDNVLESEGGVLFKTPAGKNLFLKFSEFSFWIAAKAQQVINAAAC